MTLPFFFIDTYDSSSSLITLNEETSKHVIQVLRMKVGEQLNLTDGKGTLLTAEITDAHKKNCVVKIQATSCMPLAARKTAIAISLVKNASRFEWFLEKATELGVTEIIPLLCERTERQYFRYERMKGIVVSAMLQSQQTWLPILHEPISFKEYVQQTSSSNDVQKMIAHCEEGNKQSIVQVMKAGASMYNILIGPEGDFSKDEIELALKQGYSPVALGETRLRTETAGIVAATFLCIQ
jgi:16S rRNA (uracil1498-N3)-methyltransferase